MTPAPHAVDPVHDDSTDRIRCRVCRRWAQQIAPRVWVHGFGPGTIPAAPTGDTR